MNDITCPDCGAEYTEDESVEGQCPECYVAREAGDFEEDEDVRELLS